MSKESEHIYKLNEERLAIERRIHARARLDHLLDGNFKVLELEKSTLYATIKGFSIAADASRYIEIENEMWDYYEIKDSGKNLAAPTSGTKDMK